MPKAFLIFPHQLFEENFNNSQSYTFYLLEDPLFFSQYNFHKQKIILHRASMKYYEEKLKSLGFKTIYMEDAELKDGKSLNEHLLKEHFTEIHYRSVNDDWLEQKIRHTYAQKIKTVVHDSPMFLSPLSILKEEFNGEHHLSMTPFYISQRKTFNLLLNEKKPLGGKWTYDTQNRKKLPINLTPPPLKNFSENNYIKEARLYVTNNYHVTIGYDHSFNYAVTHHDARIRLKEFNQDRLKQFGAYEDAISSNHTHLFHSVLSPYLNIGLLTPDEVLQEVMAYADNHKISLPSLEGYIRQIIGWREFMRAVYLYRGRNIRTSNYWNHTQSLPSNFYDASTNMPPVDMVIRRVVEHAYSHHIERLMILGNFMLLCEIHPTEIYKWFMELYIDAYDWVMVPNVYSMSQYADGGMITTKPYISSSNYILKMSNFKKDNWSKIWDGLYWRFIDRQKKIFEQNPRMAVMTYHLNKMGNKKIKEHYTNAENYLSQLF